MTNLEVLRNGLRSLPSPYFGANLYDEREVDAARRVLFNQSPFRFYGKNCTFEAEKFESECCNYFGVRHAQTTNSGTGALTIALHALNIGPGDEVIVPGYSWVAVTNAVLLRGAIPVLSEIDESLNLNPSTLAARITSKTRCVIIVHMSGAPADMEAILAVCRTKHIKVLEDFSQCLGGSIGKRKVGSFGDIGIASLQLNKLITSGEGGLIVFNRDDIYDLVSARIDLGYPRIGGVATRAPGQMEAETIGEGRRFNEVSAAILREQLKKLPTMLARMRAIKIRFKESLAECREITFRRIVDIQGDTGSHLAFFFASSERRLRFEQAAETLFPGGLLRVLALVDTGLHVYYNCSNLVNKIGSLPGGFPWNLPENTNSYSYGKGSLPNTDNILDRGVGINIPPDTTDVQAEVWMTALRRALQEVR